MRWFTSSPKTASFRAAVRTMSRSDKTPIGRRASSTTTSAPMLCWASSPSASRIDCSARMVTTLSPLVARMPAMFMGASSRRVLSPESPTR